jgi:hypothetical protein
VVTDGIEVAHRSRICLESNILVITLAADVPLGGHLEVAFFIRPSLTGGGVSPDGPMTISRHADSFYI